MRHLYGIALAVALAAAVFFGGGWGYAKLQGKLPAGSHGVAPVSGSLLGDSTVMLGFGALVGAALLAGLLIVIPKVSPLAAGLPGLALVAWTVLYLVSAARAVHYIPLKSGAFGTGFAELGITGALGAAGIVLVLPLFIPSRWRSGLLGEDDEYADVLEATSVSTPSRAAGLLTSELKTVSTESAKSPGEPQAGW